MRGKGLRGSYSVRISFYRCRMPSPSQALRASSPPKGASHECVHLIERKQRPKPLLQTVDKASQSFLPAGKKTVQSFSPAACTSAKILLAQRVSICALPAHMRHGSERKPSRRQSHFDFVDDLKQRPKPLLFILGGKLLLLPGIWRIIWCQYAFGVCHERRG